jgi:tetratricopeptide (TPR) repeat protein
MSWPLSQDYNEAIQSPRGNFTDDDLRNAEPVCNALGIPMPCSGNFADVYQMRSARGSWAVKCFTREVPGLRERYAAISEHLRDANLPFAVDFTFLEKGIRVRGQWYPVLKMQWVEGLTLNAFVRQYADKPVMMKTLLQIWVRMAVRLREADIAHTDLQHGNVLLVPGSTAGSLAVKLIDYDGMWVPALAKTPSGEAGHPCYQHPQRVTEQTYSRELDRFPLLLIATALDCLRVGGQALWDKYDSGDNLLFREADLQAPAKSPLFYELLKLGDPQASRLVRETLDALRGRLESAPLLAEVLPELQVGPASKPSMPAMPKQRSVVKAAAIQPVAVAQPVAQPVAASSASPWDFEREKESSTRQRSGKAGLLRWIGCAVALSVMAMVLAGGIFALSFLGETKKPIVNKGPSIPPPPPDPPKPPDPPVVPPPNPPNQPPPKKEARIKWVHNGGSFTKERDNEWVEVIGQDTHHYVEIDRTDSYVELKHKTDQVWVRLYENSCEGKTGEAFFEERYRGKWDQPDEETPPPPTDGFVSLFNRTELSFRSNWKPHPDQPGNWRVEDGILIGSGPAISHLYSDRGDYKDFRLLVEARINDGGNSGVFFHATFGPFFPKAEPRYPRGYEAQIMQVKPGDEAQTGSLIDGHERAGGGTALVSIRESPVSSGKWFTLEVIAEGNHVTIKVNDKTTAKYTEKERQLTSGGHIALQQGNSQTVVEFRKIEIKELRSTVDPDKENDAVAKRNLGLDLLKKGDVEEAILALRQAIALKPDYAEAHLTLGAILSNNQGKHAEAEEAFRKAIALSPNYPGPYFALGVVLKKQGRFVESLAAFRRSNELGSKRSESVRTAERFVELEKKLPAILQGEASPPNADETVLVARICYYKKRHKAAARFYTDGFSAEPSLAENLATGHRYDAACAAALAGRGQGEDAYELDEKERTHLRQQALAWLRADLDLRRKQLGGADAKTTSEVRLALRHWQRDPDLAGVRDDKALAGLPEAERQDWRKLWEDVARSLEPGAKATAPEPSKVEILTPAQAADKVRKKVTVQFRVQLTGGNPAGFAELYSEPAWDRPGNFFIRFPESTRQKFQKLGIPDVARHFHRKLIRVTGTVTILRFDAGSFPCIVIDDPDQILIPDPPKPRTDGEAESRKIEHKELPAKPAESSSSRAADKHPPDAKDAATKVYDKACTDARAKLLAAFDAELHKLAKQKDWADALKEEKQRFESRGLIPWSAPMRPHVDLYINTLTAARDRLRRVYKSLIDAQVKAKSMSTASDLKEELKLRLDIKVMAKWNHFVNARLNHTVVLYSNGATDNVDGESSWSYSKGVLVLRWPNPRAPGGAWIDTVRISDDGTTYDGTNQQGKAKITGAYVKDD